MTKCSTTVLFVLVVAPLGACGLYEPDAAPAKAASVAALDLAVVNGTEVATGDGEYVPSGCCQTVVFSGICVAIVFLLP